MAYFTLSPGKWRAPTAPDAERGRGVDATTRGRCQEGPEREKGGGEGLQRCIRREGASEAAPEAVRQAVAGGCQSGWGRLLSVTNAIEAGTCRQGDVAGHRLGALKRGGGLAQGLGGWLC